MPIVVEKKCIDKCVEVIRRGMEAIGDDSGGKEPFGFRKSAFLVMTSKVA
jgi:hypothetical protein